MDKKVLEELVHQGLSQRKIAESQDCSQSNIKYWLNKFNLKTKTNREVVCKYCGDVDEANFYKVGDRLRKTVCRKCHNKQCVNRFRQYKIDAIEYKGGKCEACGYDKCPSALTFHHRDPNEKDPNWRLLKTRTFEQIKKELDKCDLLCRNCHAEVHWDEF